MVMYHSKAVNLFTLDWRFNMFDLYVASQHYGERNLAVPGENHDNPQVSAGPSQ